MTGNTDMHLFETDTFKKVGVWIRKPVSIWSDHHLPHATRHISFVWSWSGCLLWPVEYCRTSLQWLCEVAGYRRELEQSVIHVDPEHPKRAQRVTCLVSMQAMKNWDIFSFQELCTDPCSMWPCIIMLKHEVMPANEWHNGPQDMCIQTAIDKMQLYSSSIA